MQFRDEYEYNVAGRCFSVEVEGEVVNVEGFLTNDLSFISIKDELGNVVSEDDDFFNEIHSDAISREYEVEEHNSNFDYYENDINSFLKGE